MKEEVKKMSNPVITVTNLGKSYWLYPSMKRRLLGCFINPRRLGAHRFNALSGLSFELYPGEAIAIIGKNGAGKSTALQVLAGITPPTDGSFRINGRLCALLELGSGFNPEFTGRQNITLAGALLGLTNEQIKQEEDNIINFADIGEFIDQPVKFYSSGMYIRLAFAVAVAGQPDLLIVDEALAVGDVFFRQKCYARLREMREKGMAVILVTHSHKDANEFCDKGILMECGQQIYSGDPKEVMVRYFASVDGIKISENVKEKSPEQYELELSPFFSTVEASRHPWPNLMEYFINVPLEKQMKIPGVALLRYCLTNDNNQPTTVFEQGSVMRVYAEFLLEFPVDIPTTGVGIINNTGITVYSAATVMYGAFSDPVIHVPARIFSCHEITLDIMCGEYTISMGLKKVNQDYAKNMSFSGYEDWAPGSQNLVGVLNAAAMTVVLPLFRFPSRVNNLGLASLPSKVSILQVTDIQNTCNQNPGPTSS